jgi:recombination protein RecA
MAKAKKKAEAGAPAKARMSLDEFRTKFGSAIVDARNITLHSGYRTTGSIAVDSLLNGGLPKGTMVEFWGPPQSGKSTLALRAAGECLKEGGRVAYFDLERGLDLVNEASFLHDMDEAGVVDRLLSFDVTEIQERAQRRTSWLRTNGIDVFNENFSIIDPDHGEHMFGIISDIIQHNLFDLVIVDSVAAIITRAEMEGQPGESHFGQVAKLLTVELKRLMRHYSGNTNTTLVFINQARDKIGYMAKGQKSTGGHALEHFVGSKLRFTKIGREETDDDVLTESIVKVDKSRYASARTVNIFVSGRRGLDVLRECGEFAKDFKYLHTSGSWYYLFEEPVSTEDFRAAKDKAQLPGMLTRHQGEESMLTWMADNGWQDRIVALAKRTLG